MYNEISIRIDWIPLKNDQVAVNSGDLQNNQYRSANKPCYFLTPFKNIRYGEKKIIYDFHFSTINRRKSQPIRFHRNRKLKHSDEEFDKTNFCSNIKKVYFF